MAISNVNAAGTAVRAIPSTGLAHGTGAPQELSQKPAPLSSEAANQALQQIQSHMESMNIGLSFSRYGNKGEEISVIVTDKDTGKVIREIPPKDIQELHTKLGELIGLIFNHSV